MQNKSKKHQKNCLIVALAAMIAFSTMAASVMTGCGEVEPDTSETKIVTETKIVEGTRVVEETVYVDADGNKIDSSKTDSGNKTNVNSDGASGSSDKKGTAQNSAESSSSNQGNSSSAQSSSGKNDSSSKPGNASNAGTSSKPDSSTNQSNSSNQSSSNTNKSKVCTVDGNKYNVGDVIVCTYKLNVPTKLENYEACIKYDSKCLKATKAEMLGSAKTGSLINYKIDGKIKFNGVNIGSGYDYTNGGDFLRVTYNVVGGGTVNPKTEWVASCEYYKSEHNYINSNGTPSKDFKVTKTYTKQESM